MPPQVDLRVVREALGLTLDELAKRINDQGVSVTKFALSNIETGRRRGGDRLMYAWARAFNVLPERIRQDREHRVWFRMYDRAAGKQKIGNAA